MFILRDLLHPLQATFSHTDLGRERAHWFVFTWLAVMVPFTSSMTANLLRALQTLFGLDLTRQRFYTFMASPWLPWLRLWQMMWQQIPAPVTAGRLLVALDDSVNNKCGRTIFGCGFFHHRFDLVGCADHRVLWGALENPASRRSSRKLVAPKARPAMLRQ